jgi:hypothetical protein
VGTFGADAVHDRLDGEVSGRHQLRAAEVDGRVGLPAGSVLVDDLPVERRDVHAVGFDGGTGEVAPVVSAQQVDPGYGGVAQRGLDDAEGG